MCTCCLLPPPLLLDTHIEDLLPKWEIRVSAKWHKRILSPGKKRWKEEKKSLSVGEEKDRWRKVLKEGVKIHLTLAVRLTFSCIAAPDRTTWNYEDQAKNNLLYWVCPTQCACVQWSSLFTTWRGNSGENGVKKSASSTHFTLHTRGSWVLFSTVETSLKCMNSVEKAQWQRSELEKNETRRVRIVNKPWG